MREFSLGQLRSFAEVIELGSFSAAAQRLGLSQPAVSLQLRQLEQRVGVRLIERVGRRAAPTRAGEEFLAHVRRIDAAVAAAREAMARFSTGAAGRVRLGTGATACIYFLPPILRVLRNRLPSLEIAVRTGNTPDVLRLLEENAIDIGLVTLPVAGRNFYVRPILTDEFVAISPAEVMRLPARVTAAELAKVPLVLYESGANTRLLINRWLQRANVAPNTATELGSVEAIKELVGAGLGCSVIPRMAVRTAELRRRITTHALQPRLARKLAIVLRRDKPLHRGLRELIRAITDRAETLTA